jgi:hypothetical protein
MPDLFDPDKDYTNHYTHYPKARITIRVIYAVLTIVTVWATIRAVNYFFADYIAAIWGRLWK